MNDKFNLRDTFGIQGNQMNFSYARMCLLLFCTVFGFLDNAGATESDTPLPWENRSISLGYFLTALDSSIRLGAGLGVDIDVEEALKLDSNLSVLRLDGMWRRGKHRLDLGWYALHRSAGRKLARDIIVEIEDGEDIVIEAGTNVDSLLDLDMFKIGYSYSFLQDERLDIAVGLGLYVAPVEASIRSEGAIQTRGRQNFTAPLPTLTLRMDVAVTPKWFVRMNSQFFYLEYEQFKGAVHDSFVTLEYKTWKHLGAGFGYNIFRLNINAKGEDYPNIDFSGNLNFDYTGLLLYVKAFF